MNTRYAQFGGWRCSHRCIRFAPIILIRLSLVSVFVLPGILCTAVSTRAKEIVVPRDRPAIQAAIDAAKPGDTIKVRPGIYVEQITVNKDVRLKGSGEETTFIRAPAAMATFGDSSRGLPPATIIEITDAAAVEMSDLTVSGPIPCGVSGSGIAIIKDATLKISESHVTRIRSEGSCPSGQTISSGRGIVVGVPSFIQVLGEADGGSIGHASITELLIDKYQNSGISGDGPSSGPQSTATISENLIVGGEQIAGGSIQSGIVLGWVIAKVTENTIRGNVCNVPGCGPDPINDFQSSGILPPFTPSGETVIAKNEVSANDVGIYEVENGPVDYVIRENVVRDHRFFGIIVQDGTGRVEENKITGDRLGSQLSRLPKIRRPSSKAIKFSGQ